VPSICLAWAITETAHPLLYAGLGLSS
jgi:hypothetical protein